MTAPTYLDEAVLADLCAAMQTRARPYFAGGIFPRELALFVAACRACDVDFVVESGRQDGYSTAVIADALEGSGIGFASIDRVGDDVERSAAARARLAGRPVELLDGDTEALLAAAIPGEARRVALLVDGPKGREANRLLLAAAVAFPLALVATHGYKPGQGAGPELARWFPDLTLAELDGPAFGAFRAWERDLVRPFAGRNRDVERSTLGLARVTAQERRRGRLLAHDRGRGVFEVGAYAAARAIGRRRLTPAWLLARAWARN